jgi:hypothetical protein
LFKKKKRKKGQKELDKWRNKKPRKKEEGFKATFQHLFSS